MRVLLLSGYYPPEVRSAAQLIRDLAQTLASRDHQVTVVTTFPPALADVTEGARRGMAPYRGRGWLREADGPVEVIRVATLPFNKVPVAVRSVGQIALAASLLLGALGAARPDVSWFYSPPLTLGLAAIALERLRGTPFVANIQDLHPQALVDLGLLRNRAAIRFMEWMEQLIYRRAARIVVHSDGNRRAVAARGASADRVATIPNWVDTTQFHPDDDGAAFRAAQGLRDRFLVVFAGVMGFAQDLDVIIRAAARLRRRADIQFLLVGDGVCKAKAEADAGALALDNLRFLPLIPAEAYPGLVAAADLCLVTLRPEVQTPVVPSKVLGIMAGGRPLLAALPPGNDTIPLISSAEAGVAVGAGDDAALAEAIEHLCDHPAVRREMGARGRRFAVAHFDRAAVVDRCEQVMRSAAEAGWAG